MGHRLSIRVFLDRTPRGKDRPAISRRGIDPVGYQTLRVITIPWYYGRTRGREGARDEGEKRDAIEIVIGRGDREIEATASESIGASRDPWIVSRPDSSRPRSKIFAEANSRRARAKYLFLISKDRYSRYLPGDVNSRLGNENTGWLEMLFSVCLCDPARSVTSHRVTNFNDVTGQH